MADGRLNVKDFSSIAVKPYRDGAIWSEAFSAALSKNKKLYIPTGRYYIDKSVVLRSGADILADKDAEIILIKGVKTLLLRNESVADGSTGRIAETHKRDEKISIEGGIWAEENDERLGYGASGAFDEEDSFHGVSTCFLFSCVKHLRLENLTFRHTAGFAVQIGEIDGFEIKNIVFDGCFADGLHINGNTVNGVIENLSGHTEDDLIALNAYDWDNSSINFGRIENLVVDGVYAAGGENAHKSMRIQPGIYPYEDGTTEDCYIKNLRIKNVVGAATFKMYLQTPAYTDRPEKPVGVGRIENISFENISADTREPVDRQPNYLNCDPVTGNFATFEVGSNVEGINFRNVRVLLDKRKYPNAYFMTVGPKSQYIKEKGLELFDPYIDCVLSGMTYEDVYINGEYVKDISPFVKEINFGNIYPSALPFGRGVIENNKE